MTKVILLIYIIYIMKHKIIIYYLKNIIKKLKFADISLIKDGILNKLDKRIREFKLVFKEDGFGAKIFPFEITKLCSFFIEGKEERICIF